MGWLLPYGLSTDYCAPGSPSSIFFAPTGFENEIPACLATEAVRHFVPTVSCALGALFVAHNSSQTFSPQLWGLGANPLKIELIKIIPLIEICERLLAGSVIERW